MKNKISSEYRNVAGVYQILNIVNGKCYIGSTIDLYSRFVAHKSKLKRNKHANIYLQSAYNKYPPECWQFNILVVIEFPLSDTKSNFQRKLIGFENDIIQAHKANNRQYGYNLREQAGTNKGYSTNTKHSDDIVLKIVQLIAQGKTNKAVADMLNVTKSFVSQVKSGQSRSYLTGIKYVMRGKAKGESCGHAKITEQVARTIKLLIVKDWKTSEIVETLGVSKATVNGIRLGRAWQSIILTDLEIRDFVLPVRLITAFEASKLSDDLVKTIKQLLLKGETPANISKKLQTSRRKVSEIKTGRTYKHILI
ncbi:GIY-YIG nuclease family protein [Spirosoma sp.]|uniref:GIY-YIG nuclease family protein n=1 Tax=Spirosoma sp. TaxID=1899569 RepID=UPI00262DF911|nr:GIY-YIG nuclease family protein [Spirosoma sp.]MCX6218342.1 GIY-YIG nuclease family protein [Spirosoma sp.]